MNDDDYPEWTRQGAEAGEAPPVDWEALPDDWRERSPGTRYRGETHAAYGNRLRAAIAEAMIPASGWAAFADRLVNGPPWPLR